MYRICSPESTTTPPIVVPCPPIHLVALCTKSIHLLTSQKRRKMWICLPIISAPWSIGLMRYPAWSIHICILIDSALQNRSAYLPFRMCYLRWGGCRGHEQPSDRKWWTRFRTGSKAFTFDNSGIGLTLYFGFPIVSTYIALVLSSMALAYSAGSLDSTNLTLMPNLLNTTGNNVR